MKTATSTEQSTESSCAFLKRPPLRFRNVLWEERRSVLVERQRAERPEAAQRDTYTERLRSSLMALISIFLRPMFAECGRVDEGRASWAGAEA